MHIKRLFFYFTLIVLLKPSTQYDDDYEIYTWKDSEEELPTTPQPPVKGDQIAEVSTSYETKQIFADIGSDAVLECSPSGHGKATWLLTPSSEFSITTSDGISSLSIKNVTHDRTYECRRSDNLVKRFVLTVNGPYATILSDSSNFVKNGTNIRLSCMVRSRLPVTSAYLRVDNLLKSQKFIANWENKKRICTNNDYNRTDCAEETTFQFKVNVTDNGIYFCGCENVESLRHSVEVLHNEPIIYEATTFCALKYVQMKIVEFAIEALEKHGLTQDAATYVRQKCIDVFKRRSNGWNCIIGRQGYIYSLSPGANGEQYSSFRFSLGSIFFTVFRAV